MKLILALWAISLGIVWKLVFKPVIEKEKRKYDEADEEGKRKIIKQWIITVIVALLI